MGTNTPNYQFYLPDYTESADVAMLNANSTKIDTALKAHDTKDTSLTSRIAALEALVLGGAKKFKPNDELRRNQSTVLPDTDLIFPVLAGKKYGASGVLYYHMGSGASTGIDMRLNFTCPSSPAPAQFNWAAAGPAVGITNPNSTSTSLISKYQASATNSAAASFGATGETSQACYISFWCEPSADGNVTLQTAQINSNNIALVLERGSWMRMDLFA